MLHPVRSWQEIKERFISYQNTAFRTRSESFNQDRKNLAMETDEVFKEPILEVLPDYPASNLSAEALANDNELVDKLGRDCANAFSELLKNGLFSGGYKLYTHQEQALKHGLHGRNVVITTGTGSGKTESFLLPLIASLTKQNYHGARGKIAAVRSLIIYPMNALVEDQLSRLRLALNSDMVIESYENNRQWWGDNRITFARYNGETPVSGHRKNIQYEENANAWNVVNNTSKISELKRDKTESLNAYQSIDIVGQAPSAEVLSFFADPRRDAADRQSCLKHMELYSRWDMQKSPPDILVTNFSMLAVMLMRDKAPRADSRLDPISNGPVPDQIMEQLHNEDFSDKDIFDKTKNWLDTDPEAVFHLVVDELHLYRGTAGTEVAYTIRVLLERLGLNQGGANAHKLRVMASSASLPEGNGEGGNDFLRQFFGIKDKFEIVKGDPINSSLPRDPNLASDLINAALRGKNDLVEFCLRNADSQDYKPLYFLLRDSCRDESRGWLKCASPKIWLNNLSPDFLNGQQQLDCDKALDHLIEALGDPTLERLKLPRFRTHWVMKGFEGVWANAVPPNPHNGDPWRTCGDLSQSPGKMRDKNGNRMFEVLYCQPCGALYLSGYRANRGTEIELLPVSRNIDHAFDKTTEEYTQNNLYNEFTVFMPYQAQMGDKLYGFKKIDKQNWEQSDVKIGGVLQGFHWRRSVLNSKNGIIRILNNPDVIPVNMNSGEVFGFLFINKADDIVRPMNVAPMPNGGSYSAMPAVCCCCGSDYTTRKKNKSPVRPFRTGAGKILEICTRDIFEKLEKKKLIAFSDSREAAATRANDFEKRGWDAALRQLFIRQFQDGQRRPISEICGPDAINFAGLAPNDLPPLVREMAEIGIAPFSANKSETVVRPANKQPIDQIEILGPNGLFKKTDDFIPRPPLENVNKINVTINDLIRSAIMAYPVMRDNLLKQVARIVFSREDYDIESIGLGFLCFENTDVDRKSVV